MHRSLTGILLTLALVAGCGGSSSSPQADASVQSDTAAGQQDGATQRDALGQNDSAGQNDASGPADHTENNGGVMHKPGKDNPLVNCTACHGSDLKGGTGPSCYSCHNSNDHTINRGGQMHRSGTSSSCSACHGPNNSGGLGRACTSAGCH
jgi:hypothetical protein